MSGPEYDPEFEAYLRRRVRFDRRLPRSFTRLEPSEDLDRIVIGMAREAIQPLPNAPLFRAPHWVIPLAMAASVLVSFALMLEVGLRPTTYPALSSAPNPMIVELSNPPLPEAALSAQQESTPAAPRVAGKAPEAAHPGLWAAVRQRLALSRAARESAPRAPSHRAMASSPAVAPAAAPAAEPQTAASLATRAAAPPTAATDGYQGRYGGGGDYMPASIRIAAMQTVVVVGRAHFDRGTPLGNIAVQTYSDYALESHRLQPAAIPDLPSGLLDDGRTARPAVRSLAGSASPEAAQQRQAHPDPKEWLEHIREVRSEGLEDAADQELKLFRDAYPAYPVP